MSTAQSLLWSLLGALLTFSLITFAALAVIAAARACLGRCPACGRSGRPPGSDR